MAKASIVSCVWSRQKFVGPVPQKRSEHAIAVVDDNVFMFGGSQYVTTKTDYEVLFFNDMYTFAVGSKPPVWRAIAQYGDIPSPRDSHTLSVIGGCIYLYGGKNNIISDEGLPGIYKFDTSDHAWKVEGYTGNLPLAVGHSASVVEQSIYVFGGMLKRKATNVFNKFDTVTNSWSQIQSEGSPPSPRCDHSSESVNDVIFIFGGVGAINNWLDDLHCFNKNSCSWTKLAISGPTPTARCCHTFVAHRDKDIYVFGGWKRENCNDVIVCGLRKWSVGNRKWKTLTCAGDVSPQPRYGHCAFICHSKLYLIGGMESTAESSLENIYVLQLINPSQRNLVITQTLHDIDHE